MLGHILKQFWQTIIQQGLEIRGFWVQKKTVQRKTVLREVYTYVLNDIFFKKNSVSSRLLFKIRVLWGYTYVLKGIFIAYFLAYWQLGPLGNWDKIVKIKQLQW